MQLKDLIVSVKEKNLSKDQLEAYRDQMSHLYAEMQMELATLEKMKAIFFEEEGLNLENGKRRTDISLKREWNATSQGQREIVLKRYCLATKELLNSLKSRLYSIY